MTECPRWRLTTAHYLNVPVLPDGTEVEWEHKEISRTSGRAARKLYKVPAFLDPKDPADQNYPQDGDLIVAHAVEGLRNHPRDIIFIGPPSPDMEPLNDEAQALTDAERPRWEHPIETLPVNGGMNSQEMAFMQTMMAQFAKQAQPATPAGDTVPRAEFDELKAKLEALLAAKPVEGATSAVARRA